MTIEMNRAWCELFAIGFMSWLGIMGVLAFAWEMFRHE